MNLYIIKSLKNLKYYVGISKNASNRLNEHNKGKVKSTKNGIPWKLIYIEKCEDLKSARKREIFLKSYRGVREKRSIINNSGIV